MLNFFLKYYVCVVLHQLKASTLCDLETWVEDEWETTVGNNMRVKMEVYSCKELFGSKLAYSFESVKFLVENAFLKK